MTDNKKIGIALGLILVATAGTGYFVQSKAARHRVETAVQPEDDSAEPVDVTLTPAPAPTRQAVDISLKAPLAVATDESVVFFAKTIRSPAECSEPDAEPIPEGGGKCAITEQIGFMVATEKGSTCTLPPDAVLKSVRLDADIGYDLLVLMSGPSSEDVPANGTPCTSGALMILANGWQQTGKLTSDDLPAQREVIKMLRQAVVQQLGGAEDTDDEMRGDTDDEDHAR